MTALHEKAVFIGIALAMAAGPTFAVEGGDGPDLAGNLDTATGRGGWAATSPKGSASAPSAPTSQITDDKGPIADLLHGFQGRASGVGPLVLWVAKAEKPGVIVQLRWINEFYVTNLVKGNVLMFGCTLKVN